MNLKLSKKLEKESSYKGSFIEEIKKINGKKVVSEIAKKGVKKKVGETKIPGWNYIFPFVPFVAIFLIALVSIFNLQIVRGNELYKTSINNKVEILEVPPYRGVIFDRNGKKLAENVPAINVTLDMGYYKNSGVIDYDKLRTTLALVEKMLPDKYKKESVVDRVMSLLDGMNPTERVLTKTVVLADGIDNDTAITVKSHKDELPGVNVDDSFKRHYLGGASLSHILGYTGDVYAEDLDKYDYIDMNDVIGKTGVEKVYDKELFGTKGQVAREVDAFGNIVSGDTRTVSEAVSGSNLYLTINEEAQQKMYSVLAKGVKQYHATGGVGILEDVNTGEILVLASYPSFDNNKFIGGISAKDYNALLKDKRYPLNNKAIASQIPPGSTFKTIVASAALDSGAINRSTVYVSRAGYTFSNGARFQEYQDHVYGPLTVVDALTVSSNLFFCETIRHWDMNKLVPYLERFGIGQYTYIDIPGEGAGMLPSPANKIRLAKTTSPWLDPVWYPEGDSCNSVIGQGITTVTPIQMANWISAIANGGTLNTPHVAKKFVGSDGKTEEIKFEPLRKNIVSESALKIVREGMWGSVNGARRVIFPLTNMKQTVAAKTGTAEFGKVNSKGIYEHTHAWVTGFFPYQKPKYAFTLLLEDGGESYYAAGVAKEFLAWWMDNVK